MKTTVALIAMLTAVIFAGSAWLVTQVTHPRLTTRYLAAERPEIEAVKHRAAASTGRCGVERWAVKTLTDSAGVNLTPFPATIAQLDAMPVPAGMGTHASRLPGESTTYTLRGVLLVAAKLEGDSDYHLVLQAPGGQSMIAEIPDPACAAGSRVLRQITATRAAFDRAYPAVAHGGFVTINARVNLTGVAFFDVLHGQRGVAPNGIELHPLTAWSR